ncbi:MAG TPA: TolC family protein [Candidatus Polarisedimenticolia bacterium]|jgi:outer membrane protein TolC|nr:TolC family protein [Candidatus Polarisedimenticolia bacterium]
MSRAALVVALAAGAGACAAEAHPALAGEGRAPGQEPAQAPLTLTRALELARQRAPALVAARAQVRSAEAGADEQRSAYLPSVAAIVSVTGASVRDTEPAPPPIGRFTSVDHSASGSGTASLRWTVYDFGRTGSAVDAAAAGASAASARAAAADLDVAAAVASAFVTLHHRRRLREVAGAIVAQRERLAVIAKGLVKAALQPPLEELRAASRAEAARVLLAGAETDLDDARAALASLLALDAAAPLPLAAPRLPQIDPGPVPTPAALVASDPAIAARSAEELPSVAAARADHDARVAAARAAAARYRPALALSIDASYALARHADFDASLDTRQATGTLAVSVPILDLSIAPGVARARADAEAARAAADQARRDAVTEAARAALAVRTTGAAVEHARRAAEVAATVLEVVQARYVRGLSSPLELIDAESADADARVAAVKAELARDLAIVRVYAATGRKLVEINS